MVKRLDEKHIALIEKIVRFAQKEVSVRHDLRTMKGFPYDIWRKMSSEKLLGLSLPEVYGGTWYDYLLILAATESFVRHGRNLGLALSWIIHLLVSRFLILGFGNNEQRDKYLEDLANGKITAAIAVSEPGTGTNPKHLKTSAIPQDNCYIINGEKSIISNGPIADIFVVFAVTDIIDGYKRVTAFLVPKDTEGLNISKPIELNFLRPSLHCGIKLNNCSVPAHNILGTEGSAYDDMVKSFRDLEDVLMMGPLIGIMELEIDILLSILHKKNISKTDELRENLGELLSIIYTIRIISYEAANIIGSNFSQSDLFPLILSSRMFLKNFQSIFEKIIHQFDIKEENEDLDIIINSITHISRMGNNIIGLKKRKLGDILLFKKGVS